MYCSKPCRGVYDGIGKRIEENNGKPFFNNYAPVKSGKRKDLNNKYFRSMWEANFARVLNLLKDSGLIKEWHYERDTFYFENIKRGTRSYTPDFKVINIDDTFYYVELKGYMNQVSRTRMKRMEKYYPEIKVEMIEKKEYREIAEKYSDKIENWEYQKNRKW